MHPTIQDLIAQGSMRPVDVLQLQAGVSLEAHL